MPNIVEVIVRAKDETAAGFKEAQASSEGLSAKLQKIGMVGGVALAGVAVASVAMAAKFDSSMTLLQTQAGVSAAKVQQLSKGVLDLAGQVGFSPDSLAEAAYHVASNMASMGATSTQMLSAVKVAAEGAAVGHSNLVDTTNALSAAIASGIPGVKNYQQAMGYLNATVGAGDMSMQNLAEAFGSGLLAVVKGYGLSLRDVGAALATFGDNNIRGAQAATDLRMAVQGLAVPTGAGKKLLESWGMSAQTLADDMSHGGLMKALDDLTEHFKKNGVTAATQGEVITTLFGKKAGSGIAVLMDQMDRLKSKYPALAAGANTFGASWATTQQTLTQKMKDVEASFEAIAIELGNRLMPVAQEVFGWLAKHVHVVELIAVAVGGLAAALMVYSIAAKTAAMITAVLDSELLANPFTYIALAIIALSLIVIKYHKQIWDFIYKTWMQVKTFVTQTWDTIWKYGVKIWNQIYSDTIGAVTRLVDGIKSAITGGFDEWWKSHGDEIEAVWNRLWVTVSSIFTTQWDLIAGIVKAAWDLIVAVFKTEFDYLVTAVTAEWAIISGVFKAAFDVVEGVVKTAWDVVAALFKVAWAAIEAVVKTAWDVIVGLFSVFLDLITGRWSKAGTDLKNAAVQVWNSIKDFLSGAWNAIAGLAVQIWNNVKGTITGVWNAISGAATSFWDALRGGFKQVVSDLGRIWSGIEGVFKVPVNFLINTVYMGGIRRLWDDVAGVIGFPDLPSVMGLSGGGKLPGFGGGDRRLALLEDGEAVVDKHRTAKFAPLLKAMGVPGFQGGGIVGGIVGTIEGLLGSGVGAIEAALRSALDAAVPSFGPTALDSLVRKVPLSMIDALLGSEKVKSGLNSINVAAIGASQLSGPGGGAPAANAALARKLHPDWGSGAMWTAWNNVAMRESGWNNTITNGGRPYDPYNVAYGIPQALPAIKMGAAANPPQSNPTAQINWMYDYIKSVYGNPVNAWASEVNRGFYANGGPTSAGWAMVGERGRELIKVPGGATVYPAGASAQMVAGGARAGVVVHLQVDPAGASAFDQFMVKMIREYVRVKGGGDVQTAFGRKL